MANTINFETDKKWCIAKKFEKNVQKLFEYIL